MKRSAERGASAAEGKGAAEVSSRLVPFTITLDREHPRESETTSRKVKAMDGVLLVCRRRSAQTQPEQTPMPMGRFNEEIRAS